MSLSEFSSSLMIHQLKPSQCLKPLQPSQPFATLETLATLEILATLETLATFEILATLETSTPSTRAKIMNEAERTWHHMNNIIGLKPSQPFTLCEPITVDLRIAAIVLTRGIEGRDSYRFLTLIFAFVLLVILQNPSKQFAWPAFGWNLSI